MSVKRPQVSYLVVVQAGDYPHDGVIVVDCDISAHEQKI